MAHPTDGPVITEERRALYAEHGALVDKMFNKGLSHEEHARLTVVRDQLDAFELAELRPDLERLEKLAEQSEALAKEAQRMVEEFAALAKKSDG